MVMEIILNLHPFGWSVPRPPRDMPDNDDTPPTGGMPVALPGPLPASIIFPMKLAYGGVR
jgi:hypothetical protein